MAFGLKGRTAKILIAAVVVALVVFLLWPKFKPNSDKYDDEFYAEQDDQDMMGADDGDEGFGPMDSTWASMQPLAATQAALQSARPDLPGVNVATDLLPKPALQQADWSEFAPTGLGAANFVDATAFIGVNTQGSALRNASHDLRADIANPRVPVGPWNNSTIESGDLSRKALMI